MERVRRLDLACDSHGTPPREGTAGDQSFRLLNTVPILGNRINFTSRTPLSGRVSTIIGLLESLEKPRAFVVRLLNPKCDDYEEAELFRLIRAQVMAQ